MTRRPHLLLTLLAALTLASAACKTTGEVKDDPATTDEAATDDEATDSAADTLLTATTVGPHDIDGAYELTPTESDFFTVAIAPGVEGISLNGETLCEIQITSKDYRTADGLGVGSRVGDFGEPGVDLFIEEANGMVYSERVGFSVTPSKLLVGDDGAETIDPDATAMDIRLGGCGE
jgi:hypothetical protein